MNNPRLRILVDECCHVKLTTVLVNDGHNAVRSPRAGRRDSPDDTYLIALSANQDRIFLTSDPNMLPDYQAFLASGGQHPGLLLYAKERERRFGALIAAIRSKLAAIRVEDLRNGVQWI